MPKSHEMSAEDIQHEIDRMMAIRDANRVLTGAAPAGTVPFPKGAVDAFAVVFGERTGEIPSGKTRTVSEAEYRYLTIMTEFAQALVTGAHPVAKELHRLRKNATTGDVK